MSRFDVVGFGALNVDKLFRVNRIAAKEEESFITGFVETCGGSAANTVVSLARLGCKVGFVGKVGSDREGKKLVTDLQREGVDTNGTIHARYGRSGTVIGFVDTKGERALYVDPGVNDTIEVAEINKEYAFQTQFLHLTSFVGQKSFQTQKQFIRTLPKNVKVSMDPGELYARKGFALLEPIIRKTFLLMPNQKELELLTGVTDHRVGTKILLEKGVKIVAVKLRERGCYVTDEKESHYVDAFKVKIADTTGAGDAFDAGLLYGLINGKSLYECGRIGNFVASRCIMRMGARTGLPALKDLTKHKLA
jgi:ribokinase